MATTIQLKRRSNSNNNDGIKLSAGEPFYNLQSKRLYIGNSNDELVTNKKHITQITNLSSDSNTIKFQIGEDSENVYDHTIRIDKLDTKKSIDGVPFDGSLNLHHLFYIKEKKTINSKDHLLIEFASNDSSEDSELEFNIENGSYAIIRAIDPQGSINFPLTVNYPHLSIAGKDSKPVKQNGKSMSSWTLEYGYIYQVIYTGEAYELIESHAEAAEVDLSNYYTKTDIDSKLDNMSVSATLNWLTF